MPDITMCINDKCRKRVKCYRFMAKPGNRQSMGHFDESNLGNCTSFMPLYSSPKTNSSQLNIFEANKNRDTGIKRAIDHANAVDPSWRERALEYLKAYPKHQFQVEEVRTWAEQQGFTAPPTPRAWGAVIRDAKKQNLVIHVGHRPTKNPKAHRALASVWEKA